MSDTEAMINVVPSLPSPDPDVEATVHDFLDYTEHLHCDVARSLRLIGTLDNEYQKYTSQLNSLTISYGDRRRESPQAQGNGAGPFPLDLDAVKLRVDMARKLKGALRARDEAATEATRMYENVDRHYSKLSGTLNKLQQIPLPDREPTPKPVPEGEGQPRITLRVADRHGHPSRTPFGPSGTRRRRIGPPGINRRRVFSGGQGREEDWEDLPDGEKKKRRGRGPRPGVGFQPKPLPPVPTTETGEPIDPKDMPWNRLLPYELARLRKRMKKNTQWTPSTTMILRELESLGRGIANKDKYMHQIESGEFPHCSPEDGGIGSLATESNLSTTENRGMKLNAAKRRLKEAQAIAASKLAAEGGQDTKMEDSVIVGPHRSMYGGKTVSSLAAFANKPVSVKAESSLSSTRPPGLVGRGKDPAAMNSLMMRASIPRLDENNALGSSGTSQQSPRLSSLPPAPMPRSPSSQPSVSTQPQTSSTNSPPPLPSSRPSRISPPSPRISVPKVPDSPQPSSPAQPPSPNTAQTDSPLTDVLSPLLPNPQSPARSTFSSPPPTVAGQKRKRSIPSSQPSPSAVIDANGSKSPVPSEQPVSGSRKRGSMARTAAASSASTRATTSPKAKQAPVVAPTPEVKPPARRGRPPGTFKVNAASRRKNALKNAQLQKVEEKITKNDVSERKSSFGTSPTKKSDGDEWEEDDEKAAEEPRYCFCNGISHGMMLGCDNAECQLAWFHLECLGLTMPPPKKSTWYCPTCKEKMEKEGAAGKGVVRKDRKRRRRFK